MKDRKVVVDSVRERIDSSSYKKYYYEYSKESLEAILKKISNLIKAINKRHGKLDNKVLGNREWSFVVGKFLHETRNEPKVTALNLDKSLFNFSDEEVEGITQMLERAQSLYSEFEPHEPRSFLNSEKLTGENPYELENKIHSDFEEYEKLLNKIESLENDYRARYVDYRHSEWKTQISAVEEIQNQILSISSKYREIVEFFDEEKTNSFVYQFLSVFSNSKKLIRHNQRLIRDLFTKLNDTCTSSRDIGTQNFPNAISAYLRALADFSNKLHQKSVAFSMQVAQEYDQLSLLDIQSPSHRFHPLGSLEESFGELKSKIIGRQWTRQSLSSNAYKGFISGLRRAIEQKKEYFADEGDLFLKECRWFQFYNSLSHRNVIIVNALKGQANWKRAFLGFYLNQVLTNAASGDLPTDDKDLTQLKDSFKGIEKEQLRYISAYWYSNQVDRAREFEQKQGNNLSVENLYNKKSSYKYKRLSLRQIVQYDRDLFTTFFPIILTTPDVCCNLFGGMNDYFDLVMFDEASQLRLEDNLPAILKGKQVVVAGDEHQMPPSNYFSKVFDGSVEDEDDLEEEDHTPSIDRENILLSCESLLDFATELNFNKRYLDFHYRSKHPYLIDFSNHAFYNRRLKPLPNDFDYNPISYIQIDGTFSEHTNEAEAEMVLAIIEKNIQRFPEGEYPTVGVATFNIAQRNLIKSKILERQRFSKYDAFNEKIQELEENGLFIKNLENIQGDERDVIIISTTYGLGKDGKFAQRFGPINHSKGYKLLNVIITRAKYKVYVCSSVPEPVFMNYKDYLVTDGNNRRGILYAYLAYCRAVCNNDAETRLSILQALAENTPSTTNLQEHLGTLESPFEEEVYQALRDHFDKDTLYVQFPYAGFKIDIVYAPHTDGAPKIAIECDGAKYHSSREAYLYDWHRQRILEGHGFVFHRIWSTNWWRNAKRETKALVDFIQSVESGQRKENPHPSIAGAFNDEFVELADILGNTSRTKKRNTYAIKYASAEIKKNNNGVAINDLVKLKYVNNGKDVTVKISASGVSSLKDGVQIISAGSPLALSILGKVIGDIVKVGNLDNFVEILEVKK